MRSRQFFCSFIAGRSLKGRDRAREAKVVGGATVDGINWSYPRADMVCKQAEAILSGLRYGSGRHDIWWVPHSSRELFEGLQSFIHRASEQPHTVHMPCRRVDVTSLNSVNRRASLAQSRPLRLQPAINEQFFAYSACMILPLVLFTSVNRLQSVWPNL